MLFSQLHLHTQQLIQLQKVLQKLPHPKSPKHTLWNVIAVHQLQQQKITEQELEQLLLNDQIKEDNQLLLNQFWKEITQKITSTFRPSSSSYASAQSETFITTVFSADYPKLLRMISDILRKIETHQELRFSPSQLQLLPTELQIPTLSTFSEQKHLLMQAFEWCQTGMK